MKTYASQIVLCYSAQILNILCASLTTITHSGNAFTELFLQIPHFVVEYQQLSQILLSICQVRIVFLHGQAFIFNKIELNQTFFHPSILFSVTKCLTIVSSFQCLKVLAPIRTEIVYATLISQVRT